MLWLIFESTQQKYDYPPLRNEEYKALCTFLKITQLGHSGIGLEFGINSEI